MSYKNYFTALFPALIDRQGYYEAQKEMNFKAVENTMFNAFAGKETFQAVVLPEDLSNSASKIAFNTEKSLRVRPIGLHDFIIPEPCTGKTQEEIKKIIALHPVAYPDNTLPQGGDSEAADVDIYGGQIVECYFIDSGPDNAGSMRGLRYRLKKERTESPINLTCLGGAERGAMSAFDGGGYGTATYGRPLTANYTGRAGSLQITNGQLPANVLGKTSNGVVIMIDAIEDLNKLAAAFQSQFNEPLKYSGYRPYNIQIKAYEDPKKILKDGSHLAARPGTSNHGWGLAIDISTNQVGYNTKPSFDSNPKYKWLFNNAAKYNWYHPRWAQEPDGWPQVKKASRGEKGSKPESWHWEWSKKSTVFREL